MEKEKASDWLRREYLKRRNKNVAFSLRAFARVLKVPSGRLSEIFSGKRKLTIQLAESIAQRLGMSPQEKERFLKSLPQNGVRNRTWTPVDNAYKQLSIDTFCVISDWYHYATLSLLELRDFDPSPKSIATRLGISVVEARAAIERLLRLELIARKGNSLVRTETSLTTTHDIVSSRLRRFHRQTLEKAIRSLEDIPLESRDITSITMAIDANKLPAAKRMISRFRRRMAGFLESGERTAVYTLNVQLFPLMKLNHLKKGARDN